MAPDIVFSRFGVVSLLGFHWMSTVLTSTYCNNTGGWNVNQHKWACSCTRASAAYTRGKEDTSWKIHRERYSGWHLKWYVNYDTFNINWLHSNTLMLVIVTCPLINYLFFSFSSWISFPAFRWATRLQDIMG